MAGPRPASPLLADERIVTLSSGVGLRGYKYDADGSKRLQGGEFFENGRRLRMEDVAEIHPMARHEIKNSSILHAAGARLAGGGGYDRIYV
ncbi:MAG: hypothetical protein FJX25_16695, partial [Alphaproteobacteria bacterium]|nr:hypothetical protein [Alphaproteobacteria bacterium]